MRFFVGSQPPPYQGEPTFLLVKDGWNDWFKWYTLYSVRAIQPDGQITELGQTKIGRRGMTETDGVTVLPPAFQALDETYFSLGQDENYYETLGSLGGGVRDGYLQALNDCAFSLPVLDANLAEPVMQESLLHYVEVERVRERFNRLARGQLALSPYSFEYHLPQDPLGGVDSKDSHLS